LKKYRLVSIVSVFLILVGVWLFPFRVAGAQEGQPAGPVYIVQAGDSLWDIAQRFGVSLDDLSAANGITDAGQLNEGQELVIPGLEGIEGTLVTRAVAYGENLRSLTRQYQVTVEMLERLNHLTSPAQLYAGYNLVILENNADSSTSGRGMLSPGQSLLELAALENANPWTFVANNHLDGAWSPLPGEVLLFPGNLKDEGPGGLPVEIAAVGIDPFPMLQGKTSVIRVEAREDLELTGSFMDREMHFFPESGSESYISLQGVHALAEPGTYPLTISGQLPDGSPFAFSQMVMVRPVDYPYDRPLTVDPSTIDPAVTRPEDAEWIALAGPATPEKLWNSSFELPSPLPKDYCLESGECWTSRYGNRRSYNGSPYNFFHTGLDVAGGTGTEIYAPAPGVVVFAGPLTVRGNATMIDHGWGVYTGYMHQSEIMVEVGERVEPGQLIGLVGGTGRADGPHLHWEVWAGGVQVEPLDWLANSYP
jgi:murein DD-endopeptidase MepM/ murein hydrolase activator NlpD